MVISRQTVEPTPGSIREIALPSSYLSLFLEQLVPESADREQVLASAGVHAEELRQRYLPLDRVMAVLDALAENLPAGWHIDPCLELEPAQHGPVGLAAISAATIGDALITIQRFERLRAPWSQASLYRDGARQVLEIRQRPALRRHADLLMEMNLLALAGLIASLLGRHRSGMDLEIPGMEHRWHRDIRQRLGCTIGTDRARLAVCLPVERLSDRCLLADPEMFELMTHRCQRLLHHSGSGRVSARVMACLGDHAGRNPGLARVARELGFSERSLSRHLASEETSYRQLLDWNRYRLAREFLRHSDLPLADIASRLGYADPANFNRAFRRWSGDSPGAFRRQGQSGDGGAP